MRLVITLIFTLFFAVSYSSYSYAFFFFDDLKKLEQDLKDLGDALEDLDNLNQKKHRLKKHRLKKQSLQHQLHKPNQLPPHKQKS